MYLGSNDDPASSLHTVPSPSSLESAFVSAKEATYVVGWVNGFDLIF